MKQNQIQENIKRQIEQGLAELNADLRLWVENHLIIPKQIQLHESLNSSNTVTCWLVTDNTGVDDSSYRIIYDERYDQFGFTLTMQDDRELYGRVGSFAETINEL